MSRFRSLRWRLTFLYLGLLAVLLLAGGVAQYFAAREVLFRTNADVLWSTAACWLDRVQLPLGPSCPVVCVFSC